MDDSIQDQYVIDKIESFIKRNIQNKQVIKDFISGSDDYSLLHHSAENYRAKLCHYLIDTIEIGMLNKLMTKFEPWDNYFFYITSLPQGPLRFALPH